MKIVATSLLEKHANHLPVLREKLQNEILMYILNADTEAIKGIELQRDHEHMPSTANHYLYDTINKKRNDRIKKKIDKLPVIPNTPGGVSKTEVLAMLSSDIGNDSNDSQEVEDMTDVLSAYWKVAVKRYNDAVHQLIRSIYTTPKRVTEMEKILLKVISELDESELEALLMPDKDRENRRQQLDSKCKTMKQAIEIVGKFQRIT